MTNKRNRDSTLVSYLAVGMSQEDAARLAGVSLSTVTRRLRDGRFTDAVEQARRERTSQITGMLTVSAQRAAVVLSETLQDRSVPASVKVRAALGTLAEQHRRVTLADIEERLYLLEQARGLR